MPARASALHPTTPSASATSFVAAELAGLKVLVVDDQSDARDLIKRVLEDCAAEVITAGTVDEALVLVEAQKPDVLISDIGMPDADGFELLRRVRALGPDRGGKVPAIALTAFARSEDRTRALRAGFLVHVSKPVDPSELVATVASVAGPRRRSGLSHAIATQSMGRFGPRGAPATAPDSCMLRAGRRAYAEERRRIGRTNLEQHRREDGRGPDRGAQTDRQPDQDREHPLPDHQAQHGPASAPSAIRIPISFVRCDTANDNTP